MRQRRVFCDKLHIFVGSVYLTRINMQSCRIFLDKLHIYLMGACT